MNLISQLQLKKGNTLPALFFYLFLVADLWGQAALPVPSVSPTSSTLPAPSVVPVPDAGPGSNTELPADSGLQLQMEPSESGSTPGLEQPGLEKPRMPVAKISVFPSEVRLNEDGTIGFTVRFDFPEGFHQSFQEDFFTVDSIESSPFPVLEVIYPETGVAEEGVINFYGSADLEVLVGAVPDITAGEYRVPFNAFYQLCNDAGTCYFPESGMVEVLVSVSDEIAETYTATAKLADGSSTALPTAGSSVTDASKIVQENQQYRENADGPAGSAGEKSKTGILVLLQFLLFAFLGGLLLNVMPCVLPVLSIRALNLVKQSENNRREIFFNSIFYTAGVVASLLILASVVILLKFSGEMVGWGFQFQNPLFTVFLITVVFVFSLSLFDVYVFQAPLMNRAVQRAGQKGYVGSFFNGIIAVLLATPCTAPLLGTALGFAFSQPPLTILSMFTLIGLGFALPFLLIGIKPAIIQKIPKPGPWMNTFKELMGFILLATVLYLFSILRYQIGSDEILRVFLFLLLLGFFLWGYGKLVTPTSTPKKRWIILGLLVILSLSAADRLLQFDRGPAETAPAVSGEWESFTPEALDTYRSEGDPVLVIFSAKWCTVCKLNEQSVLKTDRAAAFFKEKGIRVLYGDFTNGDPVIEEWIRSYGRAGVPVYAFYPSERPYTLLPEVLSFSILEEKLGAESG